MIKTLNTELFGSDQDSKNSILLLLKEEMTNFVYFSLKLYSLPKPSHFPLKFYKNPIL